MPCFYMYEADVLPDFVAVADAVRVDFPRFLNGPLVIGTFDFFRAEDTTPMIDKPDAVAGHAPIVDDVRAARH